MRSIGQAMSEGVVVEEAPAPLTTLRRQAVRGGSVFLASRLGAQIFQWVLTLWVARLLYAEDYGLMTVGTLFIGLADTLADAGVSRALVQKKELTPADLAQGFTLSLGFSSLLYLLLFLLANPAAAYLGRPEFALFLRVLALVLLLVPFEIVPGALLERRLHLGKRSVIHLVGIIPQSLLVLALAAAGYGYWALAAGALLGRSLRSSYAWYISGWRPKVAWPASEARELLRYGIHVCGAALLWFIYSNADFAVVGAMLGPVILGYYALAFQLISLPVEKLSANVNQVMFAVFCKIQDDRARVRSWFLRITVLLSFLAMPALVGLALVADDALPLILGERWRPAVLPFQLLCPIGALMVVSAPLPQLLAALGRPDINLKYNLACAVVYPVGFVVAAWYWGVVGVCLVWLLLDPLLVGSLIYLSRTVTGIGVAVFLRTQLPVLIAVAFMSACVIAVQWSLQDTLAPIRLGMAVTAGMAAYGGWAWLTGCTTVVDDLKILHAELRGK